MALVGEIYIEKGIGDTLLSVPGSLSFFYPFQLESRYMSSTCIIGRFAAGREPFA